MSWFKIDDGFWSHPKVVSLSAQAVALWVRAGSYSCQHLTDGLVPKSALRLLGGTTRSAAELVSAGLWEKTAAGWLFHDWAEYQETSEAVKARREQSRDRQRKRRAKRDDKRATNGDTTPDVTRDSRVSSQKVFNPRPDPTRPSNTTGLSAAAASPSTRDDETPQQQPADTEFADGTPIPDPPPDDAPGLPSQPDDIDVPTAIDAATRPQRPAHTDVDRTLVRLAVPAGIPRSVQQQLAEQVARLRRDRGVNQADIETGLAEWARRTDAGPKLLPNLVADAARARAAADRPHETSAVSRGGEYLAVGERLAQRIEAQQAHDRKALE